MEAYMMDLDVRSATEAIPDRDPVRFDPLGIWFLETGGGSKVPEEWLKYWPSRAVARPSDRPPTAWINAAGYCVLPEVKDIIEELAPGVHQFIPLVLEAGPIERRTEYPYFSINVADRADTVILGKYNVDWINSKHGSYWAKKIGEPIALPGESIVGKHIWRNGRCRIRLISGELHNQLAERHLASGLKIEKQIVVQ